MSQSESYGYLIIRITGSFLDRCLGTLDCSRALLTRNSRGPSRTVLDFGLKGRIPMFCLVLWLVPLLSIGPSRIGDSVPYTCGPLPNGGPPPPPWGGPPAPPGGPLPWGAGVFPFPVVRKVMNGCPLGAGAL